MRRSTAPDRRARIAAACLSLVLVANPAASQDPDPVSATSPVTATLRSAAPPPRLGDLLEIEPGEGERVLSLRGLEIREEAVREAALSYGARGGLASRSFEIRRELERRALELDRIYDFRRLLVAVRSNLMIEPPIISEQLNALLIADGGQRAAVADQVLAINQEARIVSAARDWRQYLLRDWPDVTPPPDILLPQNDYERYYWRVWVVEGWNAGRAQADAIFDTDLNRLVADFTGMVRYRTLLAQGMVSAPFANQEDRGITGGGAEMRVGDRELEITGPASLRAAGDRRRGDRWQPADR